MVEIDTFTTVGRKLNAFLNNPLGYLSYEKIASSSQHENPNQHLYRLMALDARRTAILAYVTALKDFNLISNEIYNEFENEILNLSAMTNDLNIIDKIMLENKKP